MIPQNTKKEIKKVRVKKEFVYTSLLPGKKNILTNSAFVKLKNYNDYDENYQRSFRKILEMVAA